MNKLYQETMQQTQKLSLPNNIKSMINTFKGFTNPSAMAQKMLNENPQLQAMIQAANGNPEKAFRDFAKQMNVNADEIIEMLK